MTPYFDFTKSTDDGCDLNMDSSGDENEKDTQQQHKKVSKKKTDGFDFNMDSSCGSGDDANTQSERKTNLFIFPI